MQFKIPPFIKSIIGNKNIASMATELYNDYYKKKIYDYINRSKPLLKEGEQVNIFITWDETEQDFFYNIVATNQQGLINALRPLETKAVSTLFNNLNFDTPQPK